MMFLKGNANCAEETRPRSFANATAEPVSVMAPMSAPRCAVTFVMVLTAAACAPACMKCAMDVVTAAKPTCINMPFVQHVNAETSYNEYTLVEYIY